MVVLLLIACSSPSDETASPDTTPADDTAADDTAAPPDPWEDPGWWTYDNADLDVILEDIPAVSFEVLFFTSDDGESWEESPQSPIAWGLSTLGLLTTDVGLAVTGFPEAAALGKPTDFRSVYALTTIDLETWGVRRWVLEGDDQPGHDLLVDPQVELGDEAEMRAWYYIYAMGAGDPFFIPGDHDICAARLDGDEALVHEGCPLSEEYLADPSPLMHDGSRVVAATDEIGVGVWDLDTGERRASFEGTVPFLTVWPDGGWRIYYQRFGDTGETLVRMSESTDDGYTWGDPQAPLGEDYECTSTVAGRFQGQWVLFCARCRS